MYTTFTGCSPFPALSRIPTSCELCGDSKTIVVLTADYNRWQQGELIQDVWPDMSANDRERLITGTCPACWNESFERNEDGYTKGNEME